MSWFLHFFAPRKRIATIHSVYVADGVADDCEELIYRCCQVGTLNFNVYCNIWKDMSFAWIFQCRPSGAELAELSEEALQVAKRYLVQKTTNFERTVASLFLIYSIINLQPIEGFAPLRLTPPDLEAIFRIEDTARRQNRHDVLYILASVLVKGPCQFHFGEREYGMDTGVRKYFDVITSIDKYSSRPKGVFHRQTEELDLLRELSSLGRRYARAKIFDDSGVPDKTLRYTDEHLPNELGAALKQLIDGEPPGAKAPQRNVQSIKERAMWNTIQQMRHLKQLPERNTVRKDKRQKRKLSDSSSSPTKSKTRSPRQHTKIKKGSPRKPLPTNSPKKTFQSKSVVSTSSSDNESDGDKLPSLSSSDTNDDVTADEDAEIHLNNTKTINEYINRFKSNQNASRFDNAEASTSNSNLMYEIEIIDYMADNNSASDIDNIKINTTNKKNNNVVATTSKADANKNDDISESQIIEVPLTNIKNEQKLNKTRIPNKQPTDLASRGLNESKSKVATLEKDLTTAQRYDNLPDLVELEIASAIVEDDIITTTDASTVLL